MSFVTPRPENEEFLLTGWARLNGLRSFNGSQGNHGFLTETLNAVDIIFSFIKHLGWRSKSLGTSFGRLWY